MYPYVLSIFLDVSRWRVSSHARVHVAQWFLLVPAAHLRVFVAACDNTVLLKDLHGDLEIHEVVIIFSVLSS